MVDRIKRINSLLKEVLSEVIRNEVRNPTVSPLATVTGVDCTKDLRHAKVYVSMIGTEEERTSTLRGLRSATGFISRIAAKRVAIRYFPALVFETDRTADKQMKIESTLRKIREEERLRKR
ncbi:MAG: 30S ribosome-binding factor RbfA [Simkaniaceae bacterium]|nr:30S ribosome-binding factor RbfA [Simkaniaceae bacterium]